MSKLDCSTHSKSLRANKITFSLFKKLSAVSLKGKVNIKYINCNIVADCKEPFVVIVNHASRIDMSYVALACQQPLHFVLPEYELHTKPFGKVLASMGAVPKYVNQSYSDIANTLVEVAQGGGNIALFGSDMSSLTGSHYTFAKGLGQLLQQIGSNVFVLKISGAYSVMPPYATQMNKGTVAVEAMQLLTPAELKQYPAEYIDMMLSTILTVDDNVFMRNHPPVTASKDGIAHNLHYLLYKCINCGSESGIDSNSNEIFCTTCGARATVDGRMILSDVPGSDSFGVHTIGEWWDKQLQEATQHISNGGAYVGDTVSMYVLDNKFSNDPFVKVGEGIIWLDNSGLNYQGTCNGKQYKWNAPISSQPYLHSVCGHSVDCYYDGQFYRFVLDNKGHSFKWTCQSTVLYNIHSAK